MLECLNAVMLTGNSKRTSKPGRTRIAGSQCRHADRQFKTSNFAMSKTNLRLNAVMLTGNSKLYPIFHL